MLSMPGEMPLAQGYIKAMRQRVARAALYEERHMKNDSKSMELIVGKIRHNLKTPINILMGFSELILEEVDDLDDLDTEERNAIELKFTAVGKYGAQVLSAIEKSLSPESFSTSDWLSEQARRPARVLMVDRGRGALGSC